MREFQFDSFFKKFLWLLRVFYSPFKVFRVKIRGLISLFQIPQHICSIVCSSQPTFAFQIQSLFSPLNWVLNAFTSLPSIWGVVSLQLLLRFKLRAVQFSFFKVFSSDCQIKLDVYWCLHVLWESCSRFCSQTWVFLTKEFFRQDRWLL